MSQETSPLRSEDFFHIVLYMILQEKRDTPMFSTFSDFVISKIEGDVREANHLIQVMRCLHLERV